MSSAEVFEAVMLVCFGLAWPLATLRMLQSRSVQGRGLVFTLVILAGYLAGVMSKLLAMHDGASLPPVFWLYVLNSVSVGANAALQWHLGRSPAPQTDPTAVS